MSAYAWCTDIHLDFLNDEERIVLFGKTLVEHDPAGIFITGDISTAPQLVYHLSILERVVQRPIFFVLGNHDYYRGDIESIRKSMKELSNLSPYLRYMPTVPYIALTPSTAVVGHDAWYDAGYGDARNSRFMMNDWVLISDFIQHSGGSQFMRVAGNIKDKDGLINHARKLAHDGVTHVMNGIKAAVRYHKHIVVLTHYPPFAESHIYNGRVGDADAQPWFTCKMMGDMLLNASQTFPNVTFTVLAGHTHGKYEGKITGNLRVLVGGAEYNRPVLQNLVNVL